MVTLVYDSDCPHCDELAHVIAGAARTRVHVEPHRGPGRLERPYVIRSTRGGRTRISTGAHALAVLLSRLGVRGALALFAASRRRGIRLLPPFPKPVEVR
ncbi:hypothetical protein Aau02nite_73410 [Amorphoplanes auranticolor]|uniref:Uncharacterized protein n=1 Tax=Actinoplanes auranticolor TaxID=47988 RepID=A0A919STY6_9ACTN|nr:hypothetical protein Aau02nite_73410 [Actinoplanes auranticolor]